MDATVPDDVMPVFSHREIRRVVVGLLLCILLAALDITVVVPAVPAMAADLNAFGHLSWIVTAYLLTSTAATPIYGKMSDIYGRRAILLPSIALFVVASAACALSQTLLQLILARAVQGLGGAGLMSMAQAAIADVVAPRERGRYQAYTTTTWAFASVVGPIIGGYVTDVLSWHYVFWINLPLGVLAMWLSNRALKAVPFRRRPARIDYGGAVILVAGVVCWLLLLTWGGTEYPWLSAPILGLFVGGIGLIVLLALYERRVPDPLLPPRLFSNQVFVCGSVISFFAALGMFSCIFLLPLFFQLVRGTDASGSGQMVMPFLAISTVASYFAGMWMRRLGRARLPLVCGLASATVGLGCLALIGPDTNLAVEILFSGIAGVGIGTVMPGSLVSVQNAAERHDIGVATATMLFLRSLGGAFGSTLSGTLIAAGFSSGLAREGLVGKIDLGSLRAGSDAFVGLASGARAAAEVGLVEGFHYAFGVTALLLLVAVGVAWMMHDVPLRSAGEAPSSVGH
jgi:EmrB/QacA subfamily drug resistance transporter